MAKNKVLEATNSLVALLQNLKGDDRARALDAALSILGDAPRDLLGTGGTNSNEKENTGGRIDHMADRGRAGGATNAKAYMDRKDPKTKVEELAVAAHYREQYENSDVSTKDQLREVFKAARRNFDSSNFRRDLSNARVAGLFTKGGEKNSAMLSAYGQTYVDTLPDREALKKLVKPKGAGRRSSGRKTSAKRTLDR